MTGEVVTNDAGGSAATESSGQIESVQYRMDKWSMLKTFIFRLLFTYFIFSMFRKNPQPPVPQTDKHGLLIPASGPATNMYQKDDLLDVFVYLTESANPPEFTDESTLFWHLKNVRYGDWEGGESHDGSYTMTKTFKASEALMNNGSMFIHTFIVKAGYSPDPHSEQRYSKQYTIYASKMITRYRKRRITRTVNLLTGQSETPAEILADPSIPPDAKYMPLSTHWHPNLTINLVDDHTNWVPGSVPSPINEYIRFYPLTNQYYPVVYFNDYWNLNEEYMPVNATTPELTLRLTFAPISLFKWQMFLSQSMRKSWYSNIIGETEEEKFNDDFEQDTFKKTLLDTNPYLLALTVVVSIVHSVFELLAFKNDIQFWKSRESFEGLSVRSVFFNIFYSAVVVLYVLDNDTNFVVKVSVVIALGIEIWKVKKVVNIAADPERKLLGSLPYPKLIWQSSYVESETKIYDQMAFKYLSWVLFPLLAAYAGYSLIYEEHRGWYSWVLSMLYGFFLTFGFIAMTPQLFINYKMKSVAHLPWRMLTYKALNTFIDDLFAFVIRTPTLYRIGCLRDDVIFFIYLYQRWIYPMDPKRVNEFGISQEMISSAMQVVEESSLSPASPAADVKVNEEGDGSADAKSAGDSAEQEEEDEAAEAVEPEKAPAINGEVRQRKRRHGRKGGTVPASS
uniref:Cleft lip and palate transmembrane protein 1 homolog n=1 Tax=Schistocephalus solidus TaxID=70667 RepID=A0A0X3Q0C2_SCHSO